MDIPNANHFIYKRYSDAEMMEAFSKVLRQMPKPSPVVYMNSVMADAVNASILGTWEVLIAEPCPNCKEMSMHLNHCDQCDYPYNK